jgi:stage IV sporulation protein FB
MRDLFSWSIPLGRLFGVQVKVHILFPFIILGLILYQAWGDPNPGGKTSSGAWIDVAILGVLLFLIVLAHEFGHVFGARSRWVDGDANEILMWPLGGLAFVDIPHNPRAHFLTAAAGPFVNVLICIVCAGLLVFAGDQAIRPPLNPLPSGFPIRYIVGGGLGDFVALNTWGGETVLLGPYTPAVWLARTFWLSYFLFLFNVVLVAFPLDGGRMLQAGLWPYLGYRQATLTAVYMGFLAVFVVGLYAIVQSSPLAMGLAIFFYASCRQEMILLETGGEESAFGYDFSQGYTSLERGEEEEIPRPRRRIGWFKRWMQRRAARRAQRERETREAEEHRLDELLAKIAREGKDALTDEERRFLMRVSDRYKQKP